MMLYKNIITSKKPTTQEEIINYFRDDERIKGKRLTYFKVELDHLNTSMDCFADYRKVHKSYYDLIAIFE